jgi:PASTA domain
MTTCKGSRTSPRFSAALPARPSRRTCAAFGCIWRRVVLARQRRRHPRDRGQNRGLGFLIGEIRKMPNVTVPDLVGSTQSDAEAKLRDAKLTGGRMTKVASDKPSGSVLSMNPAAVCDHAGSSGRSQMARPCVWPSTFGTVSAPGMIGLSRFNGWPVRSPADASPAPLRTSAHGSGPMWIATPSP